MSAIHAPVPSPVAGRPAPSRASAADVVLTLLVVVSGPLLLVLGAVLMSGAETSAARLLRPEPSTLQVWGAALEEQRQALTVGDLQAVEELIGLLCVALGVLLGLLAALSVAATALLQLSRRVGVRRGTALLELLSPGFMRRALVVALGAQMAVMGTVAGVSSSVTSQTTMPTATAAQDDQDRDAGGETPDAEDAEAGSTTAADSELVADRLEDSPDPLFAPAPSADEDEGSSADDAADDASTAEADAPSDGSSDSSSEGASGRSSEESDGTGGPTTPRPAGSQRTASPEPGDRLTGGQVRTAADEADHVVVRSGDTLWSIAAEHLGDEASDAQIAAEWPRWYAANRATIGDDPSQLLPGMVLELPDDAPSRS
ncbi:LysM peptidoglycan-binding domain-containing protein [Nesterenkonia sp. F]|uniref:LysM peptidoglycan-binding domain-containing protein n=1 Tax=Nesterenkonia sp. F TaxID=795955 RepID=UPI000255CE8E|nr:peptidoglycan-binding protein [Nesterenkonia sp. F]